MADQPIDRLQRLFQIEFGLPPDSSEPLPQSGSDRIYWRFALAGKSVLGVWNPDPKENQVFVEMAHHFAGLGVAVPTILRTDPSGLGYLVQDLGNTTLLDLVAQKKNPSLFPESLLFLYKESVRELARMQILGGKSWDYQNCYPKAAFDRQSILWDLQYFKYYFLKPCGVVFDEEGLEQDFSRLADWLMENAEDFRQGGYFMFRDFQARNIMVLDGRPWFIDFQGGRNGPLQYDLASLLYQAKASLPDPVREILLKEYLETMRQWIEVDEADFRTRFRGFVLIRILQTLGAYGFRGWFEGKAHFLESIPYAMENLFALLGDLRLPIPLPVLQPTLQNLYSSQSWRPKVIPTPKATLTLTVMSFSYKKGLPTDHSGNGGGFLFDCRAIENPGRYAPYKALTGKDSEVIQFLKGRPEMEMFFTNAEELVEASILNYLERGFENLFVGFGCTGGQHRSVYCAEKLAEKFSKKFPIQVKLIHRESNSWPVKN